MESPVNRQSSQPDNQNVMQNGDTQAPDLAKYKRMFTEAQTITEEARKESQTDDDYFNGFQFTAEERRLLQERRQPDIVFNRVRPAVLGSLGVIKQGKTSPRAYARTPDDEQSSDVVSKVLRFIADESNFQATRIDCSQQFLVQGTCAVIVEPNEKGRIEVVQGRWEEFFYDPRARRQDFADARYMGFAKWMYADDVEAAHPELKGQIQVGVDAAMTNMGMTFADRPNNSAVTWIDPRRRRILVVEMYHREGANWYRCQFYGNGIIEAGLSPYKDERGASLNPIIAQSCFIDRENNRYGIVRDMRGPQDEINKRRAKLLHMLNSSRLKTAVEGFDGSADVARKEASRPDGVIPYGFEEAPTTDKASGQFELLNLSTAEIERMGPNPAVLGRSGEDQSGRAQLVRQQAGMTELAVVLGGIEEWELRVYRACWVRAKQFWKAPDYVRVTDDMNAPQYIGINQPITQNVPAIVQHPETGMPMVGTQQVVLGYDNSLAELDVDIILDTVAHTQSLQQEQFQMLVDLARSDGIQIPLPLLIQMSSLPNKADLLQKLQELNSQPDPKAEMQQQIEVQTAQADIAEKGSVTLLNNTKAQVLAGEAHLNAFATGLDAMTPLPAPAAGDNGRPAAAA